MDFHLQSTIKSIIYTKLLTYTSPHPHNTHKSIMFFSKKLTEEKLRLQELCLGKKEGINLKV